MKKFLILLSAVVFIAASMLVPFLTPRAIGETVIPLQVAVSDFSLSLSYGNAKSAAVIDAESGSTVFSHSADERRGMASTTKIMTALVALESCDPDAEFEIPREAVGIEGSSVYLVEGERLTVRELLYCLLLESGNDAAVALAVLTAGSVGDFCDRMNGRAASLGLTDTHFDNPHGLSYETHYTTARELAIITAEAMKNPLFCEIIATKSAKVRYCGVENGRRLTNHNKLLSEFEGALGVKTGYTKKDGRCLVSAAEKNGITLICVTLDDPTPRETHKRMLEEAFSRLELVELASAGELEAQVPLNGSYGDFLTVRNTESISLTLPAGAKPEIRLILPSIVDAPIKIGDTVGYAEVYIGDSLVYIIPLTATTEAEIKKESIIGRVLKNGRH